MPRRNDISKILIRNLPVIFAVLLLGEMLTKSDACSIEFRSIHVAPSFQVRVQVLQHPIGGMGIALYRAKGIYEEVEKQPFIRMVTDGHGTARVKDLPDGFYVVEMEGPGGTSMVVVVGSKAKGDLKHSVTFEWPARTPMIKTSRLAGRLLDSNFREPLERNLGNAQLELWTAGAQAPIATATASPDGHFQFTEKSPGVYVLHVSTKGDLQGEMAVELSPSDSNIPNFLSLHLKETSCGLQYRRCATPPVDITSREIQIVTAEGKPWTEADFQLEDGEGGLLAKGRTDNQGNLELPANVSGLGELRLAKYLFEVAVEQPIRLRPSVTSDAPHPVVFAIQFDDVCSRLTPENHATSQ
jgi:hypothetical protein